MEIAIALTLVAAVVALHTIGPGYLTLFPVTLGLVLAVRWLRRGRWQIVPTVLAISLCGLANVIGWGAAAPVWLSAVIVFLTTFALLLLYWSPLPHTPKPGGNFAVGFQIVEIPQFEHALEDRQQIHLWYPAEKTDRMKPRKFFTDPEATVYSGALRALGAPGFLQDHFRLASTHSFNGASPADGNFPLVIFNHGGAMWPTTNFSLMEELASHGFITCSVSHAGESAGVLWGDGSATTISVENLKSLQENSDGIADHANYILCQDRVKMRAYLPALTHLYDDTLTSATKRWAALSIAIVDWLISDKPQGSAADIASRIDRDKIVYCGMSLGGSVAHECCYLDARAAAGINLDGMNWTFDRIDADVPVPFLQLYGDPGIAGSEVAAKADRAFELPQGVSSTMTMYNDFCYESPERVASRGDVLRVLVPGAGHMAFTDLALSAKGPMRKLAGIGCVDGRRTAAAVNELCRLFLTDVLDRRGFERSKSFATDSAAFVLQVIHH